MLFKFTNILLILVIINCTQCKEEMVTLKRSIENKGFHRFLVTTFEFKDSPALRAHKYCEWLLVENFTRSVYVDYFELKNYARTYLFKPSSKVSIEKAEYNSDGFELFVFPNRNVMRSESFTLRVPFHLRYHAPTSNVSMDYLSFELNPPRLFLSQCVVDVKPLNYNVGLTLNV
jgi:hypothetical protein